MAKRILKPPYFCITNRCIHCTVYRSMTAHRRVQDRSEKKRIHDLEIATEKWKITSKMMFIMEVLKQEKEQIMPVRSLDQYRRKISLPKVHRISDFLRKSPKLFELYKDKDGILWCGLTKKAEELVEEEEKLIANNGGKAAEYVTRMLMMSVDKVLPLDKIGHFRRDLGLPIDFREKWVHNYPECFRVIKNEDGDEFLELVKWNPSWAMTELEKKVLGVSGLDNHVPGVLSLPFPMKFPPNYKKVFRYYGQIDHFQKRSYLSPYADARELKAGSEEFDKRAVAVMHEMLSFMNEKRLVTDHLTHFRREFVMPQKLMRLLLKHFGIFYVSERGKRFSVFLTEAYEGSELIEKCPLNVWKEKLLGLTGHRGRKKKIVTFDDVCETEDENLFDDDSEDENHLRIDEPIHDETIGDLVTGSGDSEMEIGEVCSAYKDQ